MGRPAPPVEPLHCHTGRSPLGRKGVQGEKIGGGRPSILTGDARNVGGLRRGTTSSVHSIIASQAVARLRFTKQVFV